MFASENEIKSCCFRVAKNMLQTSTNRPKHELASAKHLLENCVKLLDAKTYPELVTSAYYLLSELYLFGTVVNVDDTSEAAAAAAAADNLGDRVQEETMINTLSSTGVTDEPNVSFFHIFIMDLVCLITKIRHFILFD